MPALPAAVALSSILAGAPRSAAPVANNDAALQNAINDLIGILGGGTAGQVLTAVDASTVEWAAPLTAPPVHTWLTLPKMAAVDSEAVLDDPGWSAIFPIESLLLKFTNIDPTQPWVPVGSGRFLTYSPEAVIAGGGITNQASVVWPAAITAVPRVRGGATAAGASSSIGFGTTAALEDILSGGVNGGDPQIPLATAAAKAFAAASTLYLNWAGGSATISRAIWELEITKLAGQA